VTIPGVNMPKDLATKVEPIEAPTYDVSETRELVWMERGRSETRRKQSQIPHPALRFSGKRSVSASYSDTFTKAHI